MDSFVTNKFKTPNGKIAFTHDFSSFYTNKVYTEQNEIRKMCFFSLGFHILKQGLQQKKAMDLTMTFLVQKISNKTALVCTCVSHLLAATAA